MITVGKSEQRRHVRNRLQDTWMTFDSANGVGPFRRGFHGLECLNEDRVAPEISLHSHGRKEWDLLTYVREGALIHQDEAGGFARLGAGGFQRQTLSSRMRYHAVNGSPTDAAHVFQSFLPPQRVPPGGDEEQKRFTAADRTGSPRLIASRGEGRASLSLDQDVRGFSSILLPGSHLIREIEGGRTAWLHVAKGRILLQDSLRTGDGVALVDEPTASFTAREPSEILPFDLA